GAGLMVKGFTNLIGGEKFMRPETLLTLRITLPESAYKEDHRVTAMFNQVVSRFEGLPGVQSASAVSSVPHSGYNSNRFITIEGRPAPAVGEQPFAQNQSIGPAYFRALALPLRKGGEFTPQDGRDAQAIGVSRQQQGAPFVRVDGPSVKV